MAEPVSRVGEFEKSRIAAAKEKRAARKSRVPPPNAVFACSKCDKLSLPDWPPVTRTRSRAPRCLSVVKPTEEPRRTMNTLCTDNWRSRHTTTHTCANPEGIGGNPTCSTWISLVSVKRLAVTECACTDSTDHSLWFISGVRRLYEGRTRYFLLKYMLNSLQNECL